MKIERKKNAILGTIWGLIQKIVQIVFPFVIRTIFIRTLGMEYLGLNSLFTSILQVFNLAELGVSSALVFSMYKPIVTDDKKKICALMNLYKKYYRIIGLVILIIGIVFIPFIQYLINDKIPTDIDIYIIYLLNLASTVLSYWLFAYRNSLLTAHQRNDITSIITLSISIIKYIIQTIFLIVVCNYYVYLIIEIIYQILLNIVTAMVSKKYFPQYYANGDIVLEEKKEIFKKVRDLFTAKIGGVINNSTDSIVISSFIGLEILAMYQNYFYIISTLMAFFMIFYSACHAGIANSLIIRDKEDNKALLYNINHISFWMLNFCCTSLICLFQPFMELWVGKSFMLDFSMVILFALYLFAEIAPRTLIVFKDAGGIWREDRFRPLIVASSNLVMNLILVKFIGLYGIVISTVCSLSFIGYPWLISNINKYLFEIDIKIYVNKLIRYVITIIVSAMFTYFICCQINTSNLYVIIAIRLLICLVIPNFIFFFSFSKTKETKYLFFMCTAIRKNQK